MSIVVHTYTVIRKKIGSGWNDGAKTQAIYTTNDENKALEFLKDDIEDMKAKWPELGEERFGQLGGARWWDLGNAEFGLEYQIGHSWKEV